MSLPVNLDEHLVKVPLIAGAWPTATQPLGVGLPELDAPLPDGFVGDRDAPREHHLLHLAEAQREPVVQPHAMADDLHRIAEPSVRRRTGAHQPSPLDPPRRRSVDHPSHQAPPKLTMPPGLPMCAPTRSRPSGPPPT